METIWKLYISELLLHWNVSHLSLLLSRSNTIVLIHALLKRLGMCGSRPLLFLFGSGNAKLPFRKWNGRCPVRSYNDTVKWHPGWLFYGPTTFTFCSFHCFVIACFPCGLPGGLYDSYTWYRYNAFICFIFYVAFIFIFCEIFPG